jgi:hypothetical protein
MSALRELVYGIQNARIETIRGGEFYAPIIGIEFQQLAAKELDKLEDKIATLQGALQHIQERCEKHGSKVGWYYDFGEYIRNILDNASASPEA